MEPAFKPFTAPLNIGDNFPGPTINSFTLFTATLHYLTRMKVKQDIYLNKCDRAGPRAILQTSGNRRAILEAWVNGARKEGWA